MSMYTDNSLSLNGIRKAQSTLMVSGRAVLFFTVWEIIKVLISFLYASNWLDIREMFFQGTIEMRIVVIVTSLIIVGIYAFLQLKVGFSAIAESNGRKKSGRYLFFAFLLMMGSLISIIGGVISFLFYKTGIEVLLTTVVELTYFVAVLDLFTAARKLRMYRKKLAE